MTASNFEACLPLLLQNEGGFVDDPDDPGGATCLGVTLRNWQAWCGRPVTIDEMKALTGDKVSTFYRANFWDAVKGDELPSGLDYLAFDGAVNQGPARIRKWIQVAAEVGVDGILGAASMAAIERAGAEVLIPKLSNRRRMAYTLTANFDRFGNGWLARLDRVTADALKMATAP